MRFGDAGDERWAAGMAEIWQAAGMLTVQHGVTITEALDRLHVYAISADRPVSDVAGDILHRGLQLSAAAMGTGPDQAK